jgi:hypothetical protein
MVLFHIIGIITIFELKKQTYDECSNEPGDLSTAT